MTAGEDLRWTLDKLSVIAAETLGDPLASLALLDWVKASRILDDRRNQLTHSFYLPSTGEQALTRMKASTRGGKWKGQSEPIGLADLSEVAWSWARRSAPEQARAKDFAVAWSSSQSAP